jgi:hypothetical protein
VEGAHLSDPDPVATLSAQYQEAEDFLRAVCDLVLGGDLHRLFVSPGNHDVCWSLAMRAMRPVAEAGDEALALLSRPNSPFRWSWRDGLLYEIVDLESYSRRLEPFKTFFDRLYRPLGHSFHLEPERQVNHFVLPSTAIFTAYSSLHGNDCFLRRGRISENAIALANVGLRGSAADRLPLRVAFWHHSVEPIAYQEDYLDASDALPLLIDRGYVIGLHGHQHRSGVIDYAFRLDPKRVMPVVACGSLCAGSNDLPSGYRRQYNIIEFDQGKTSARVHVREWFENRTWVRARLHEFGGQSFADVQLPLWNERIRAVGSSSANARVVADVVEEADRALRSGDADRTIHLLHHLPATIPIVRQLRLDALEGLGRWAEIVEEVKDPANTREALLLVEALCRLRAYDRADMVVSKCLDKSDLYDRAALLEFRKRIEVERHLGGAQDG